MKIVGLIIGILLMVLAGVGVIVTLLLPSLTNNRVNFREAAVFFIPAILVLVVGFLTTLVSAIFMVRARRATRQQTAV